MKQINHSFISAVAVPPKKRSALRGRRDKNRTSRTPSPGKSGQVVRESHSTPRSRFTKYPGLPKPRISSSAPEQRLAEKCTTGMESPDRECVTGPASPDRPCVTGPESPDRPCTAGPESPDRAGGSGCFFCIFLGLFDMYHPRIGLRNRTLSREIREDFDAETLQTRVFSSCQNRIDPVFLDCRSCFDDDGFYGDVFFVSGICVPVCT